MDETLRNRVLVICEGNTCRSPVLACLLLREAYRIGRTDLCIQSAGSDVSQAVRPNVFAIEALRKFLNSSAPFFLTEIMHRLQMHESRSLNCYASRSFDLIVSLLDPEFLNLNKLCITALELKWKEFDDFAWRTWRDHNFPKTLAEDRTNEVLEKYCEQTALLATYAEEVAHAFFTENA